MKKQLSRETLEDPVVQLLQEENVPVTRRNYLEAAGLEEPLDPEVEANLPEELRGAGLVAEEAK
jgi:hypothetical protein